MFSLFFSRRCVWTWTELWLSCQPPTSSNVKNCLAGAARWRYTTRKMTSFVPKILVGSDRLKHISPHYCLNYSGIPEFMGKGLTILKVIHVLVVVISCGLCCCRLMDRVFNFSLVLLTWPPSVNICGRRRGRKSRNNGLATGALFFSSPLVSRFALRAKCHVRLAWLIKRLLCM